MSDFMLSTFAFYADYLRQNVALVTLPWKLSSLCIQSVAYLVFFVGADDKNFSLQIMM